MKILYHGKQVSLGFEAFVAPSTFDRATQDVDIFDIFLKYYQNHRTAKYIYSVSDVPTSTTFMTVNDTNALLSTHRYGYELYGTSYTHNKRGTYLRLDISGSRTDLPVKSVNGFESSGSVRISTGTVFNYDSIDATPGSERLVWSGAAQTVTAALIGTCINPVVTWETGSTKRWVIIGTTTVNEVAVVYPNFCYPVWLYCGNGVNGITHRSGYNAGGTSYLKYIHANSVNKFTVSFTYGAFSFTPLTGNIVLSENQTVLPSLGFASSTLITGTLKIPAGVTLNTAPYNGTFLNCTGITSLDLSEATTQLGYQEFQGMTGLSGTLSIGSGISYVNAGAFLYLSYSDVESISSSCPVYDHCLYNVNGAVVEATYNPKNYVGSVTIRDDCTKVLSQCFRSMKRTGNLVIPDSVTVIDSQAFGGNPTYFNGTITLGSGLLTIAGNAFVYNWLATGSLTIPNSVTSIGASAFESCSELNGTLTIGTSVQTIGNNAFATCSKLTGNIVIPNSTTTIGSLSFAYMNLITGTLTLGSNLTTIGATAFRGTPLTGTLSIPSSITSIGEAAFSGNKFTDITSSATGFTVSDYVLYDEKTSGQIKALAGANGYSGTLTLKTGTTQILQYCFNGATGRTGTITILATVTSIGQSAFESANAFTALVFDGTPTIATIAINAFYNCKALTGTLTLPASLGTAANSIAANAFSGSYVENRPQFTVCNSYNATQPGAATNAFAFRDVANASVAIPLHIPTGSTSYIVAPWTNTAIFSSVTADL